MRSPLDFVRVFVPGSSGRTLLLLRPEALRAAILFRPMLPLEPETLPDLAGVQVRIAAGNQDPIVPTAETQRLVTLLRRAGADVAVCFANAGHGLTPAEIEAATRWLQERGL